SGPPAPCCTPTVRRRSRPWWRGCPTTRGGCARCAPRSCAPTSSAPRPTSWRRGARTRCHGSASPAYAPSLSWGRPSTPTPSATASTTRSRRYALPPPPPSAPSPAASTAPCDPHDPRRAVCSPVPGRGRTVDDGLQLRGLRVTDGASGEQVPGTLVVEQVERGPPGRVEGEARV